MLESSPSSAFSCEQPPSHTDHGSLRQKRRTNRSSSHYFIVGAYIIIFGLVVAGLEFQIPPQVSRYASFLFSFIGRGICMSPAPSLPPQPLNNSISQFTSSLDPSPFQTIRASSLLSSEPSLAPSVSHMWSPSSSHQSSHQPT